MGWGFTGIFAKENGGGFLTDHFPKAAKAIWNFEGASIQARATSPVCASPASPTPA